MKPYLKNFYTYHNITPGDFIPCAISGKMTQNVHHISGRPMGNKSKRYDVPENLIPVNYDTHILCEARIISKQECKEALYKWAKTYGTPIDYDLIMNFK
jgi:hypothetical protein